MKFKILLLFITTALFYSCKKEWDGLRDRFSAVVTSNPGNGDPIPYRTLGTSHTTVSGDALNPKLFQIAAGDTVTITRKKAWWAKAKKYKDEITGLGLAD